MNMSLNMSLFRRLKNEVDSKSVELATDELYSILWQSYVSSQKGFTRITLDVDKRWTYVRPIVVKDLEKLGFSACLKGKYGIIIDWSNPKQSIVAPPRHYKNATELKEIADKFNAIISDGAINSIYNGVINLIKNQIANGKRRGKVCYELHTYTITVSSSVYFYTNPKEMALRFKNEIITKLQSEGLKVKMTDDKIVCYW